MRSLPLPLLVATAMLTAGPAEAVRPCRWIGGCLYESPAFRITVIDRRSGRPLADVHALAEWHGYVGGRTAP